MKTCEYLSRDKNSDYACMLEPHHVCKSWLLDDAENNRADKDWFCENLPDDFEIEEF
jgi:hypothetical protein